MSSLYISTSALLPCSTTSYPSPPIPITLRSRTFLFSLCCAAWWHRRQYILSPVKEKKIQLIGYTYSIHSWECRGVHLKPSSSSYSFSIILIHILLLIIKNNFICVVSAPPIRVALYENDTWLGAMCILLLILPKTMQRRCFQGLCRGGKWVIGGILWYLRVVKLGFKKISILKYNMRYKSTKS